jgi:hypothetical protein
MAPAYENLRFVPKKKKPEPKFRLFLQQFFDDLQRAHVRQEFAVRLRLAQLIDQQFHSFDR